MRFLGKTATFAIFLTFFMYNYGEPDCEEMARKLTTQESNKNDAKFFKKCIVDYFGFGIIHNTNITVPQIASSNFYDSKKRPYIELIAKRVERFFIRNGNWYNILQKKDIFKANDCRDLLYVVTAKYVYALYVLHTLKYELTVCIASESGKYPFTYSITSRGNICYIKPLHLKCAEEIELNLLGRNSGSLTALFNQFFKEPIGEDRTVPGFKEDSDILMGVRVSAFSLENVFPQMFRGSNFIQNLMLQAVAGKMISSAKMKLLSVAVAIFRMKSFSGKYFNELLSDQSPLRAQTSLAMVFQHWGVELTSFDSKIKSFMESPHYNYELNYRRRHKIAFQLVIGRLESKDEIPSSYVRLLAQYAICLVYNTPVYLTSGAVRHAVIKEKLTQNQQKYFIQLEDYWHSMLENWAIATRVYKKECLRNKYKINACLLRMSKSLYLMFDAMVQMKLLLQKSRRGSKSGRLGEFKETMAIAKHWMLNYRNKGRTKLPILTPPAWRRPFGMTLKRPFPSTQQDAPFDETDDFPEWGEPEQTIENEKTTTETVAKPLGEDVESPDDTKSLTKDIEGAHKTEPLTKDSEITNKEKLLVEKNEDADVQRKTKLLDKNVGASVGSRIEVQAEKNDGKSSGIYLTSPLTPDFLDLADTEELDNFGNFATPQEVKPLYADVDAAVSPVKRTFSDEDMARSLHEDEGHSVRRTLSVEDMARSLDEDEESPVRRTLPDEDMARSLHEDEGHSVRRTLSDEDMARSLDEDEESPVRRTLPDEDMAKFLNEDEEPSVRRTLSDEDMARSLNENEESFVRQTLSNEAMARSLDEDEESFVRRTLSDEGMARSLDEDEDSPVKRTLPDEDMARSLDEDEETSIDSSMVEPDYKTNMNNDTASMIEPHSKVTAGSSMTNPMDMNDNEQMRSSMDEGKGESIGSQMNTEKSVDASMTKPENKDIKETAGLPIRQPLNEDSEESMGSPMAKPLNSDHKESLSSEMTTPLDKHTEETTDLLMRKPLHNDMKESAGAETTKPLNKDTKKTSGSPMVKPLDKDIEKTSNSPMVKPLDKDTETTSDSPMVKPLDKDTEKTSDSPMVKPLDKDTEKTSESPMVKPPNKDTEKTSDSPMVKPLDKDTEKTSDSPMAKPLDKDTKKTSDSPMVKPLDKDTEKTSDSPMVKPLDKDTEKTSGSPMVKPLDKDTEKTSDSPMAKPLDKDTKKTSDSPMVKPLDKDTEKTSDSPMVKPLDKDTKKTLDSPMVKPLDKGIEKTSDSPMVKPLGKDTKRTSNSPMVKPLDKNVKETAGVETEEPTHDDFLEYPTSDAHDVPRKTTRTKSVGNKTQEHPRFFSRYYRRGRYGYRSLSVSRRRRYSSVSRRRRSIYVSRRRRISVGRRRRYSSVSRRRRSIYVSRRRRISAKPKASRVNMGPDETKNIKIFLQKFYCHFRPEIERMKFQKGCMDKIQLSVRKFNRVAFSHFAQRYGKSFRGKMRWKKPKENVLVKTEL